MLLVIPCVIAFAAPGTLPDRLEIEAHIDPDTQRFEVTARYEFQAAAEQSAIEFYLNKNFVIEELTGPQVESHRFEHGNSMLDAVGKKLTIRRHPDHRDAGPVSISLRYSGTEPQAFLGSWVEVFADRLWVPTHPSLARVLETRCRLSFPRPHQVLGVANWTEHEGAWTCETPATRTDLAFVASPELFFADFEESGFQATLATGLADGHVLARPIADELLWILEYYHQSFGAEEPHSEVRLVIRPEDGGLPAYARPGYIVLHLANEKDWDHVPVFQLFAHEAGHLWWCKGDPSGYENWLNESFAEYVSLLAVRERFDDETFEAMLERRREVSGGLPPILGLERTHPQAGTVFYKKGCVLLHDFAEILGRDEFEELLGFLVADGVDCTADLLTTVSELYGDEPAQWLERRLRE